MPETLALLADGAVGRGARPPRPLVEQRAAALARVTASVVLAQASRTLKQTKE